GHRIVQRLYPQGHHLAGAAERRDRLLHCRLHRPGHRLAYRGHLIADRDDARADPGPVRIDRPHVRRIGHFRHRASDAHRARARVQAMTGPVVEAIDVVRTLGVGAGQVEALKGVSLSVACGELTLLMGPSGSGKTTLLSVLGCMLTPTAGTVRVRGRSTTGAGAGELARLRRDYIGFVFQSYHLFPTLNAVDNVRLALDVRGERSARAIARAKDVLVTV